MPRLVQQLAIARADGSYTRLLARIAKVRVLVLDDFMSAPLKDAHTICDRVVHHAHVITLTGPSGRKQKGLNTKS